MSRDAIYLNGKYYNKLHMDILESEFEGDYIRNKNIQLKQYGKSNRKILFRKSIYGKKK